MTTTWRKEINKKVNEYLYEPIIFCTLSEDELDVEFDCGYGGTEGKPFTAWTESYVLFPVSYDGAEWVGYTFRNPSKDNVTGHQGGG